MEKINALTTHDAGQRIIRKKVRDVGQTNRGKRMEGNGRKDERGKAKMRAERNRSRPGLRCNHAVPRPSRARFSSARQPNKPQSANPNAFAVPCSARIHGKPSQGSGTLNARSA